MGVLAAPVVETLVFHLRKRAVERAAAHRPLDRAGTSPPGSSSPGEASASAGPAPLDPSLMLVPVRGGGVALVARLRF
jgi:hypothetical protein